MMGGNKMKDFLKMLLCLIIIACLTIPMVFVFGEYFDRPVDTILTMLWSFPCGFITAKVVLW